MTRRPSTLTRCSKRSTSLVRRQFFGPLNSASLPHKKPAHFRDQRRDCAHKQQYQAQNSRRHSKNRRIPHRRHIDLDRKRRNMIASLPSNRPLTIREEQPEAQSQQHHRNKEQTSNLQGILPRQISSHVQKRRSIPPSSRKSLPLRTEFKSRRVYLVESRMGIGRRHECVVLLDWRWQSALRLSLECAPHPRL